MPDCTGCGLPLGEDNVSPRDAALCRECAERVLPAAPPPPVRHRPPLPRPASVVVKETADHLEIYIGGYQSRTRVGMGLATGALFAAGFLVPHAFEFLFFVGGAFTLLASLANPHRVSVGRDGTLSADGVHHPMGIYVQFFVHKVMGRPAGTVYRVSAVTNQGKHVPIVDCGSPDAARYVEQLLETRFGMEDRRVPGELED